MRRIQASQVTTVRNLGELQRLSLEITHARVEGRNAPFFRHINPDESVGGFRQKTTTVEATTHMGPHTVAAGRSKVLDNGSLHDFAILAARAIVRDRGSVRDRAVVAGGHIVKGDEVIAGTTRLTTTPAGGAFRRSEIDHLMDQEEEELDGRVAEYLGKEQDELKRVMYGERRSANEEASY